MIVLFVCYKFCTVIGYIMHLHNNILNMLNMQNKLHAICLHFYILVINLVASLDMQPLHVLYASPLLLFLTVISFPNSFALLGCLNLALVLSGMGGDTA